MKAFRDLQASRTVKVDAGSERRIEVTVLRDESGKPQVLLQDLSYGPGLGWYPQKTIRLDREQAEALLKALCCARQAAGGLQPERLTGGTATPTNGHAARIVYLDPNRSAAT